MTCISGFVDAVMFLHNERHGASCIFLSAERVTSETTAWIATKFLSTTKMSKYISYLVGIWYINMVVTSLVY